MALERGKVTLCFPNYTNSSTMGDVISGNWRSELPLDHLKTPILSQVARSVDTNPNSTRFNFTLDSARSIDVVTITNHNLTTASSIRVRVYGDTIVDVDDPNNLRWDSGWLQVWPSLFASNTLEWEFDNFWLGTPLESDIINLTTTTPIFLDNTEIVKSVLIEIEDEGNGNGYVQIGRVFVGGAWQPKYNAEYGISYGYDIGTTSETAFDANKTTYFDVKTPKRFVSFNLSDLTEEEGFQELLRMQRLQGIHGEILYTEDTERGQGSFAKTFLGRNKEVSPLINPYFNSFSNSINLVEIL